MKTQINDKQKPNLQDSMLYLFNKPFQVLCQFSPEGDKRTLKDYIDIPRIYPAGRLDYDSEGLLLLTDDGPLQHAISSPKFKLAKTYWAQVEGIPTEEALEELRKGTILNDGPTQPAKVKRIIETKTAVLWERTPPIRERKAIPTTWIEISITEGRNRQVRRMCAKINHPCLRLIRVKIGKIDLLEFRLEPGQLKAISPTLLR